MHQDNEEIDDVFRSALEPMEAEPSAQFWENAEQQIALRTGKKKKRKGFFFVLFLIGGAGLVFSISYFNSISKKVTAETTTTTDQLHSSNNNNNSNNNDTNAQGPATAASANASSSNANSANASSNNASSVNSSSANAAAVNAASADRVNSTNAPASQATSSNNNTKGHTSSSSRASSSTASSSSSSAASSSVASSSSASSSRRIRASHPGSSPGVQFSSGDNSTGQAGNHGGDGAQGSAENPTSSSTVHPRGSSTVLPNDTTAFAKTDTASVPVNVIKPVPLDTTDYTLTSFNLDSFPYTPPPAKFSNGGNSGFFVTAFFAPLSTKAKINIGESKPNTLTIPADTHTVVKQLEGFSYTAGLKFGMALGEKWSLHAGLSYSSFTSAIPPVRLVGFSMTANSLAQYSLVTNFGFTSFRFREDTVVIQKQSYLRLTYFGVPLEGRYHWAVGRFDFSANVGLSAHFLMRHDAHFTFEHTGSGENSMDATITGLRKVHLRYSTGLGAAFNVTNQFKISADPYFFGSLLSINRDTPYLTRIRGYGLEAGLTYTF